MHREDLFEVLVPNLLQLDPSLLLPLVNSGNKLLHQQTVKATYEVIEVSLPINLDSKPLLVTPKVNAILRNPHLGDCTKSIRFHQASSPSESVPYISTSYKSNDEGEARGAIWSMAADITLCCPNVKSLEWNTAFGMGGSLWEAIASLQDLRHLSIGRPTLHPLQDPNRLSTLPFPRITPRLQLLINPRSPIQPPLSTTEEQSSQALLKKEHVVGNGGWGLGVGWENLETLRIGPLSETGSKTIANHFTLLSMHSSSLTSISLETQFLDILLCTSISKIGALGLLTHVELSTSGTRLTAECINIIITECLMLESLKLNGVDGHLSKDTWSSIEEWPQSFKSLEIVIPEYSKRFSWVLDHLESIHHIPFNQLQHFAISRGVHPINLLPFPSPDAPKRLPCPPDMGPRALPETLLQAITSNGQQLQTLCLDWWEVDQEVLIAIMTSITYLKTLHIALGAPFAQALNIPNSLNKSLLKRLLITSDPARYPSTSNGKIKIDYLAVPDSLASFLTDQVHASDPNLPDPKDLKKFARRLPRLQTLEWAGTGGRGIWQFSRKSAQSSLITIDFTHSAITTMDIWERCQESPPCQYGEILDNPILGQMLEIPSYPSTWTLPLQRSTTIDTDEIIETPGTRKSSQDDGDLPDFDSDQDERSLFDSAVMTKLTSPETFSGITKVFGTPRRSENNVSPAWVPNSNEKKVEQTPRQPGSTSFVSKAFFSKDAKTKSPPSSPSHYHGRGSSRSWHYPSRNTSTLEPEIISPRVIPGSGGRQSLPVEVIGGGLKKAVPIVEKTEQKIKDKNEVKKEKNVGKMNHEHGWTVVGAPKTNPIKNDKSKKDNIPTSKK